MSDRRSIVVEGLGHGTNPIPAAARIGPFVATGGIRGVDPATGQMPADVEGQVSLMFANLETILTAGGADLEDVLKMTFWLATPDARAPINAEWIRVFPDPERRPARHVLNYALGHGMVVQCDALAVIS